LSNTAARVCSWGKNLFRPSGIVTQSAHSLLGQHESDTLLFKE